MEPQNIERFSLGNMHNTQSEKKRNKLSISDSKNLYCIE